jgi:hypothetical protein
VSSEIILVHPELSGVHELDSAKAELLRFLKATGLTIADLEHARAQFATRTTAGAIEATPSKANEPSTVDIVAALIARDRRLKHNGDRPLETVRSAHKELLPRTLYITDLRERVLLELCGARQIQDRTMKVLPPEGSFHGVKYVSGERAVIDELIAIVERMDSKALTQVIP